MGSLDGLHVEVEDIGLFGVRANGCISAVRQRARLSVAETADIVLVPAEVGLFLVVGCSSHCCQLPPQIGGWRGCKPDLESAEVLVDVLPGCFC